MRLEQSEREADLYRQAFEHLQAMLLRQEQIPRPFGSVTRFGDAIFYV